MNSTTPARRGWRLRWSLLAFLSLLLALPLGLVAQSSARADVATNDLVFSQQPTGGGAHIYLRKDSDGSETQLTSGTNDAASAPDVSSDGSRIVYDNAVYKYDSYGNVIAGGNTAIFVMNSDGSVPTQLTYPNITGGTSAPGWFYDSAPRWSADGMKIVFTRETYDSTAGAYRWHIVTMDADGSHVTDLTPNDTFDDHATFSPDGSMIAYENYVSSDNVAVMGSDGSSPHIVVPSTSYYSLAPEWSPDGTRLYLMHGTASGKNLEYLTSSDGFATAANSTEHVVEDLSGRAMGTSLRVSGDGSSIYFDGSGTNVYKVDISAGTDSAVTSGEYDSGPTPVKLAWPSSGTKALVALGDSVAAGEGINYGFEWDSTNGAWDQTGPASPTWTDTAIAMGTDYQGCHQTGYSFPNLVHLDGGNYKVLNMACTGASAANGILGGYTANGDSVPAQLGWGGSSGSCTGCSAPSTQFDSNNPDKVLLTVGADDIDFKGWLHTCYTDTAHCSSSANTSTLNGELSTEEGNLRLVLTELNRWAGTKSKTLAVYVTNYYDPFSTSHTGCIDVNNGGHFPGISVSGTGNALSWLMSGLSSLNTNISSEVTYAQGNDSHLSVHLVDLSSVMSGHEFCTSDPWVYGPSIDYPSWENWTGSDNPTPFHPTPDGQRAIEGAVSTALAS